MDKDVEDSVGTYFVFESWLIDKLKDYGIRYRNSSSIERELINNELTLNNMFELRRGQDPGFNKIVYDRIINDEFALLNAKKLMFRIISEVFEHPSVINKLISNNALSLETVFSNDNTVSIANNKITVLDFYKLQRKRSVEDRDFDRVFAIDYILNEYTHGFVGFNIHTSLSKYENKNNSNLNNALMKYFVITNLNHLNIYNSSNLNYRILHIGDFFTPYFSELITKYIQDFLDQNIQNKDIYHYNKTLRDIMSVISIDWFLNLDFEEKISLLNGSYDLETIIEDVDVNKLIKSEMDIEIWFMTNRVLNELGFHSEGLSISLKIQDLDLIKNNAISKTRNLDDIAFGYKSIKDYKNSIKYFRLKVNALKEAKPDQWVYQASVALKNVVECYGYLNNTDKKLEYIFKVERTLDTLTDDEKFGVYFNLAKMSYRLKDFESEKKYTKIASEFNVNDPNMKHTHQRLKQLTENDNTMLLALSYMEEVKRFLDNAKIQMNAWNFKSTEAIFNDLTNNFDKYDKIVKNMILFEQAKFYFEKKDFTNSIRLFTEFLNLQSPNMGLNIFAIYHLMILGIITRNDVLKDDNFKIITRNLGQNSSAFEDSIYICCSLIFSVSGKNYKEFIEELWSNFDKNNIHPYSIFGKIMYDIGDLNLSQFYYEKGIQKVNSSNEKEQCLIGIAQVKSTEESYEESIDFLEKALDLNPKNKGTYKLIAEIYSFLNNYTKSIEVLKRAQEKIQDQKIFEEEIKNYELSIKDILNIDEKLWFRNYLLEGEKLFQYYQLNSDEKTDVSGVLIEYSKFVESTIDEYIVYPFVEGIIKANGWNIQKNFWPKSDDIFNKYKHNLEKNHKKKVTLGQIQFVFDRFDQQRKSSDQSLFEKYLNSEFTEKEKSIIYDVCSTVSGIRNKAAHEEIITLKILTENRPGIISSINSLISIIMKKDSF